MSSTVYRFPHTTYPYSSCICSFLQQHPYFLFILFILLILVIIILQDHLTALLEVNEENETLVKQYDREKQKRKEIDEVCTIYV